MFGQGKKEFLKDLNERNKRWKKTETSKHRMCKKLTLLRISEITWTVFFVFKKKKK